MQPKVGDKVLIKTLKELKEAYTLKGKVNTFSSYYLPKIQEDDDDEYKAYREAVGTVMVVTAIHDDGDINTTSTEGIILGFEEWEFNAVIDLKEIYNAT